MNMPLRSCARGLGLCLILWLGLTSSHAQKMALGETSEQATRWRHLDQEAEKARRLCSEGKFSGAVERFRYVLGRQPTNDYIWADLAQALEKANRPEEALKTYQGLISHTGEVWKRYSGESGYRAIGQRARDLDVVTAYVKLCLKQRHWQDAVRTYQAAAEADEEGITIGSAFPRLPADFDRYGAQPKRLAAVADAGLGIWHYRKLAYDKALAAFRSAVQSDPGSAIAHYYLGYALNQEYRSRRTPALLKESLEEFRTAASLAGRDEKLREAANKELRVWLGDGA